MVIVLVEVMWVVVPAASNNVNSTTGPGAQITTITPQSSIPTVQLGARTFDIGTIASERYS